jgi:hypothetical protein
LPHHHGAWKQEEDAQDIVVKDHTKFGQFDILGGKLHVQDVARGREAVQDHPKDASPSHVNVIPSGSDGSGQHDTKGSHYQIFRSRTKEVIVSKGGDNVGDVLKDGNHGDGIVLQRSHSGEEHETKENIDGSPLSCGCHVEIGVFYQLETFAGFDAHDRHDGLKDN